MQPEQSACPSRTLDCDTLRLQTAGIWRQIQRQKVRSLQIRSLYILGTRPKGNSAPNSMERTSQPQNLGISTHLQNKTHKDEDPSNRRKRRTQDWYNPVNVGSRSPAEPEQTDRDKE